MAVKQKGKIKEMGHIGDQKQTRFESRKLLFFKYISKQYACPY